MRSLLVFVVRTAVFLVLVVRTASFLIPIVRTALLYVPKEWFEWRARRGSIVRAALLPIPIVRTALLSDSIVCTMAPKNPRVF